MTPWTRCTSRIARTPIHRTQWRRIPRRHYSSAEDNSIQNISATYAGQSDESWFEKLREEMLKRELPKHHDTIDKGQGLQLYATLHDFFPKTWHTVFAPGPTSPKLPPVSVGNHLIHFNPAPHNGLLLPDGTDTFHSPRGPFVRRMWAGGSLRINRSLYFDSNGGWKEGQKCICVERIKDVRLHGQDATAKIFVTIERRFARKDQLTSSIQRAKGSFSNGSSSRPADHFGAQVDLDGWGDAFMVEERNLVFMRERSTAELEDIKAGKMTPTRYLNSPGTPEFSHALTPTSAMLFRFSSLTFNAHAIHLDRDYARNVEGHRNLLVHGPLTLLLMVKLISGHLKERPGAHQIVQSIEYRNLAPLYCDEELRLCAREKTGLRTEEGSIYDVWIEGPTGGMAVKGTVRTGCVPKQNVLDPSEAIAERKQDKMAPGTKNSKATTAPKNDGIAPLIRSVITSKGAPLRPFALKKVASGKPSAKHVLLQRSRLTAAEPTPSSIPRSDATQPPS